MFKLYTQEDCPNCEELKMFLKGLLQKSPFFRIKVIFVQIKHSIN